MEIAVYDELTRGILADIAALRQECETLRKDAASLTGARAGDNEA